MEFFENRTSIKVYLSKAKTKEKFIVGGCLLPPQASSKIKIDMREK